MENIDLPTGVAKVALDEIVIPTGMAFGHPMAEGGTLDANHVVMFIKQEGDTPDIVVGLHVGHLAHIIHAATDSLERAWVSASGVEIPDDFTLDGGGDGLATDDEGTSVRVEPES